MSGERPDWFNMIAASRGLPSGWSWFRSEWKGEGQHAVMLVKGGVAGHVFARGPRKGKPNPKKRTDVSEMVVTRDDLKDIKQKWQAETGNCAECYGTGHVSCGWSAETGPKTRGCRACGATGKSVR